ncbi:MAG: DUF262 domain-containing HNH endonuclease family protein [Kiritimatiellae bacterium]|nr:DUF262 domain-containing HNH endonuclease family protein [Kiritimatiellia bacterium]
MAIQSDHKNLSDLIMGDLTQFHIPIYQRSYTWVDKINVEKLINDILEFGMEYKNNSRSDYYIGNLIVKNQTKGFLTERVVIDGQQRITTTILILCAIRDVCIDKIKTDEAIEYARNISKSLYTSDNNKIKLKLNNMEHQSSLQTILTGAIETITESDKKTKYWINYKYLYLRLKKMEVEDFFNFANLLERVKVVIIFLDDDQDENSVFESINSLGKPLSGSDLIKNFLFTFKKFECTRDEEKRLTDLYTKNFESLFADEKEIEIELEKFFREYIALYTHLLVKKDPKIIYYSFKKLVGELTSYDNCKDRILDLVKWGLLYQTIRKSAINGVNQSYLEYLRASFGTYASLLMDVFEKYSTITDGSLIIENPYQLNRTLTKIVAYDASRFIAGHPSKEITRFIPSISSKLESINPLYFETYAESFETLVTTTGEGYKQPSINTLKRAVSTINLYDRKRKPLLRFLILLENIGKKEILSFEHDLKSCQIEHILPQTLNKNWDHISKHDYESFIHTLGNLSITFNNQDLSNKGFDDKKSILIKKSRISLNNQLLQYDVFDGSAIEDRANNLLNLFIHEFDIPNLSESENCGYITDTPENLDTHSKVLSSRPSARVWKDKIPELKNNPKLNTWNAICIQLGIDVGSDSARRRLKKWVNHNRPQWLEVPDC